MDGAGEATHLPNRAQAQQVSDLAEVGIIRGRETRWELGEMEPSYAAVTQALHACELAAVLAS